MTEKKKIKETGGKRKDRASKVPGRKPKRQVKTPVKKVVIRKDPAKEYSECMKKDGMVEVLHLTDDDCLANVKLHISTQSLALDRLLNSQGIPTGRVTEIFGPEHIGKSTLLDHLFARVQTMGGVAILGEPEGARQTSYTQRLGVDVDKLLYLQFKRKDFYLENILQVFIKTIDWWREKAFNTPVVLGLDALGGSSTKHEVTEGLEKPHPPGAVAKVMREISRRIPCSLGNTNIALVICNHEYQLINTTSKVGKKRETYGGGGLRHLASIRLSLYRTIDINRNSWIKDHDGAVIGQVVGAKLVKNRLGEPWGTTRFALISGVGINNVWTLHEKFREQKLIAVNGGWSAINLDGNTIKFQGWAGLQQKCEDDPELFQKLVSVYRELS